VFQQLAICLTKSLPSILSVPRSTGPYYDRCGKTDWIP